ncbi:MAG TPA: hypothetical protein VNX88_00465 [Terriglobales bacterium]|nr:hypothetical protein [Terriglobales bacterium]
MKKLLVTSLLAFAACGFAQDSQSAQPGQTASGQQAGAQPQQKTIKDPAEYNAYMSAISNNDPNAKAQSLEAFLQQYPNTVVKEETLEQLMGSYQAANNAAKTTDAANRLLQANPNNVRALALLTYLTRAQCGQQTSPQAAQQLCGQAAQYAQRGLQAADSMPHPAGVSDADFAKLQNGVKVIFNGAIGMDAVQRKDYPTAQKALSAAISVPENANNLQDVYPLATAYLQANPPDSVTGLFYAARAVDLAQGNPAAQQQIEKFAQYYYKKYHGSLDGWDEVKQKALNSPAPPPGFTITPAPPQPTPCEFADTIMKQNPDVSQMAYGDWLFVLGSGNEKDAQQVWAFLNGKGIPVSSPDHAAKVISATPDELQLATTDDNIHDGKADVTLRMATPLPAAQVPQPGTLLQGKWVGKATSYTPLPPAANQGSTGQQSATSGQPQNQPAGCLPNTGGGVMLTLTEGAKQGTAPKKPAAPAKRGTAAKKKPAARH